MPTGRTIILGIGLLGLIALHQVNDSLALFALLALGGAFLIRWIQAKVGPITPPSADDVSDGFYKTIQVPIRIAGLPLLARLTVVTEGEDMERLLERFSSVETWQATIQSALRGFDSRDSLVIENAVESVLNEHTSWLNKTLARKPKWSSVQVVIEELLIDSASNPRGELRPLGSESPA